MKSDVILCGVGGQGTILVSRLLASAAMERGLSVKTAETIGMAQRGGSVFSHVRIGGRASSPLIGRHRADLVVGLEPAEALRQLDYLREGGTVVVSNRPIVPVSAGMGGPAYDVNAILDCLRNSVRNLVTVDAEAAARDLGSARCLNVVLLGAAVRSGAIGFSIEEMREAVDKLVPERFLELNRRALLYA